MRSWVLTEDEIKRALDVVAGHTESAAAARFAYEVVVRHRAGQGPPRLGGRTSRKLARRYAAACGALLTPFGDLRDIAAFGAIDSAQWAVLGAFAVRGCANAVSQLPQDKRKAAMAAFVERAIELEVCGGCPLSPWVGAVFDGELRALCYGALSEAVLRDESTPCGGGLRSRAFNAARAAWLSSAADAGAARAGLRWQAKDPMVRALLVEGEAAAVSAGAGDGVPLSSSKEGQESGREGISLDKVPGSSGVKVESAGSAATMVPESAGVFRRLQRRPAGGPSAGGGVVVLGCPVSRPPPTLAEGLVRVLFGRALLSGLGRAFFWLIGLRKTGAFRLEARQVRLCQSTRLCGTVVDEQEEAVPLSQLASFCVRLKAPLIVHMMGLWVFSLCALTAALVFLDAAMLGHHPLIGLGCALLGAGALLDFSFFSIASLISRRMVVELRSPGRVWWLYRARQEEAQAFLEAMSEAIHLAVEQSGHACPPSSVCTPVSAGASRASRKMRVQRAHGDDSAVAPRP